MEGSVFDAPHYPKPLDGPLIFLAGPIQGAPLWHDEAILIIRGINPSLHIASPARRTLRRLTAHLEHLPSRLSTKFTDTQYYEQVDWETHYLNRAADEGAIMFWLAKEHRHICTRAYAQTSRFELGEWVERSKWYDADVVVGIEPGFSNERYLRHRLLQNSVPVFGALEETCAAAVASIKLKRS